MEFTCIRCNEKHSIQELGIVHPLYLCFGCQQGGSHYMGIDPSLTGNATVVINEDGEIQNQELLTTYKDCYINDDQRILDIFESVHLMIVHNNPAVVYVEGLSYMSVSQSFFERCGLLYLITTYLFKQNFTYKVIPPKTLKLFAAGNGNANKDMMKEAVKTRWGIDFEDDNLCDAFALAQMARKEAKQCRKQLNS